MSRPRQDFDLAFIQKTSEFQSLDEKIQLLISSLSQGMQSFEALRIAIQSEGGKTRDHISAEFQKNTRQRELDEYRAQVLKSLWYAEIHTREESIADAHKTTFEWIFDDSGKGVRPWHNFVQWLESGSGIYWIQGKAGSGKSTLVSLLFQDERTKSSLQKWSGSHDLSVPRFFFWSGGTTMQKSTEGLLRSLIWQIMDGFKDFDGILEVTNPTTKSGPSVETAFHSHSLIAAWTQRRLQKTLFDLVQQQQSSCKLCFFIDGLDEYCGDEDDLISLIEDLAKLTNVKICLSSRPHRSFAQAFGSGPNLRLQDLTHNDIQFYVSDKLQDEMSETENATTDPRWVEEVVEKIVSRAEGVFLWVELAVKDQIRGIRNEDSSEQLDQRLSYLPSKVEDIYARMLTQIERPHRKEASRFLQMALLKGGLDLVTFTLATSDEKDLVFDVTEKFPERRLVEIANLKQRRIASTCAGFLEIHKDDIDDEHESSQKSGSDLYSDSRCGGEATDSDLIILHSRFAVSWIHRTVIDFMRDSEDAKTFLNATTSSDFIPEISYAKAIIMNVRLFGWPDSDMHLQDITKEIRCAESKVKGIQTSLCVLLDRTMSRVDESHKDWSPDSHWCTRLDKNSRLGYDPYSVRKKCLFVSDRKDDRPMLVGPYDFLGLAASYGLSHYVLHIIDSGDLRRCTDYITYLLFCAVLTLRRLDCGAVSNGLIANLLKRGGNPSMTVCSRHCPTIWSLYLDAAIRVFAFRVYRDLCSCGDPETCVSRTKEGFNAFLETTAVFLENEAAADEIWTYVEANIHGVNLSFRMTAMTAIQIIFSKQAGFEKLEQLCASRGGRYYLRCETTAIRKTADQIYTYDTYEILEQESDEICDLWLKVLAGEDETLRDIAKFRDDVKSGRWGKWIGSCSEEEWEYSFF